MTDLLNDLPGHLTPVLRPPVTLTCSGVRWHQLTARLPLHIIDWFLMVVILLVLLDQEKLKLVKQQIHSDWSTLNVLRRQILNGHILIGTMNSVWCQNWSDKGVRSHNWSITQLTFTHFKSDVSLNLLTTWGQRSTWTHNNTLRSQGPGLLIDSEMDQWVWQTLALSLSLSAV